MDRPEKGHVHLVVLALGVATSMDRVAILDRVAISLDRVAISLDRVAILARVATTVLRKEQKKYTNQI